MSHYLRILENEVQIAALAFLIAVYIFKLIWMFRFKSDKERTFPAGNAKTGVILSLLSIAIPWKMEAIRKKPGFYAQFVIFHIGIALAISATFIIPYWPELFKVQITVRIFQLLTGTAFFVGLLRIYRRVASPTVRKVSSLDDYFSLILVTLYLASAVLAVRNYPETVEWPLIVFFGLTAFLLIYVPFSKISHYFYYPFARYFLGKTLGHRGVIAKKEYDKILSAR